MTTQKKVSRSFQIISRLINAYFLFRNPILTMNSSFLKQTFSKSLNAFGHRRKKEILIILLDSFVLCF